MADQNTGPAASYSAGYGAVSQIVHWTTAPLILGLIAIGLYSKGLPLDTPWRDQVLMVHKSFGLLAILLAAFQLFWTHYVQSGPGHHGMAKWEVLAARTGHTLLYVAMLLMPLSGVMMSAGSGRKVGFFNLVNLPQLLPLDPTLSGREQYYYKLGKFLHDDVFQWMLNGALALHLAGIAKHHFIDGNRQFIYRMWGWTKR